MAIRSIKDTKDAINWFEQKVRTATGMRQALLKAENSQRNTTLVGKMFFFRYDAKHKDTLPVWDQYPLIFPLDLDQDGMLGLNLHYLSIPEREIFLKRLMKYATATNLTERSRLRLSYELISGTGKLIALSRPCIKRYLWNHVRTKFIEIPATEWQKAINLPIELFVYKK